MTNNEAIKILNAAKLLTEGISDLSEACKMAIPALERQTPKKPRYIEVERDTMDMETGEEYKYKIDEAHCCNCNSFIGDEDGRFDEHYCNKCGQAIDWSEEGDSK